MRTDYGKPIIFAGASIEGLPKKLLGQVELRSPVRLGDLDAISGGNQRQSVIILDGVFGGSDAVTPRECVAALRSGMTLVGASSMGALRAADLWSLGMIGIGKIYDSFRLGLLRGDGEVAVRLDPDTYAETTISMVYLRASLGRAVEAGLATPSEARIAILRLSKVYYLERDVDACVSVLRLDTPLTLEACQFIEHFITNAENNPKRADAGRAIQSLLARIWIPSAVRGKNTESGILPYSISQCQACGSWLKLDEVFCSRCASASHEQE